MMKKDRKAFGLLDVMPQHALLSSIVDSRQRSRKNYETKTFAGLPVQTPPRKHKTVNHYRPRKLIKILIAIYLRTIFSYFRTDWEHPYGVGVVRASIHNHGALVWRTKEAIIGRTWVNWQSHCFVAWRANNVS